MKSGGDILVGLDAGTSVIKAVAYDLEGHSIADASVHNETFVPARGAAEQDIFTVWDGACACLRDLARKVRDLRERTIAVGVTAQGDGLWPLGRGSAPPKNALIWLDGRSAGIVQALRASGADRSIFRHTGTALSTSLQSAQLAWLKSSRDPRLDSLEVILHCKDWLYYRLTSIRATDRCEAVNSFGDLRTGTYSAEVLQLLDVEDLRHLLPEIIDGARQHHPLTRDAAAVTGLIPGTPIVLAPPDYVATSLAMGLVDPRDGIGCTIVGSAGVHMAVLDDPQPILSRDPCGYCVHAPLTGTYVRMISHMTGSISIDWLVENVSVLGRTLFGTALPFSEIIGTLEAQAVSSKPATILFQPFMAASGERAPFIDPYARAQLIGLTQSTTVADILRAIYEGLGFAARDCYEEMDGLPRRVHASGGASKSPLLMSILASMLGAPVAVLSNVEAGARGAALIAGVSTGAFSSLVDEARKWQSALDAVELAPDPPLQAVYERAFPMYRRSYRRMHDTWRELATLGR
jgi:erythritol kinase (D-erythritol 1-phosphate-forming)